MKFLEPSQVDVLVRPKGLFIDYTNSPEFPTLRQGTGLPDEMRWGDRVGSQANSLVAFAQGLNRWILGDGPRLIWIDYAERAHPSLAPLLELARAGAGEMRSIESVTGHLFEESNYHQDDPMSIIEKSSRESDFLIGILSIIISGCWNGFLLGLDSLDKIEFREDYIYFYSSDGSRLIEARNIFSDFEEG